MSARAIAKTGAAVAAVYLAVAAVTFSLTDRAVRPLFDGVHGGQVPYNWVNPPPEEEATSQPPQSITGEIRLTPSGSRAADFRTPDSQAGVVFFKEAFVPAEGERFIDVSITPLDPATVGEPPAGLEFQGNAYRYEARYRSSGQPAETAATDCDPTALVYVCSQIILRTPFGAFDIHRKTDDGWIALEDSQETGNDIFGDSVELGTFVASAPEGHTARAIKARNEVLFPQAGFPVRDMIAIGLGVIATVGGTIVYRRRLVSRKREEVKRRAAGRKYKPADGKRALKK